MIVCPCCKVAIAFEPGVHFCVDCSPRCYSEHCAKRDCVAFMSTPRDSDATVWAAIA